MKQIESLTSDPKQTFRVVLDDGSHIEMTIEYRESQSGWFYSFVYGDIFTVYNRRLVNSPNMLRQFRNIIPFGLSCVINDGNEPIFLDDFTTGRASLYVLNATDVEYIEEQVIPRYV